MNTHWNLFFVIPMASVLSLSGANVENAALAQAKRALAESIPQVAIEKIESALSSPELDPELRPEAVRLLAESLRMSGRRAEALAAIKTLEDRSDPATVLLRAEILASDGEWKKAERLFARQLAADEGSLAARVGLAECLQAQGRTKEAVQTLEPTNSTQGPGDDAIRLRLASLLVEAGNTRDARVALAATKPTNPNGRLWHRYLEGRLHLLEGNPNVAETAFREVFDAKSGANENLIAAAAIGLADARIATNGYGEEAEEPLETFLWRFPESRWVDLIFRRLDQVYAHEHDPDENEMQQWILKKPDERAALARFYLARLQVREGKKTKAKVSLDSAINAAPNHRLTARLYAMRAELFLEAGAYAEAVSDLEAAARLATTNEERAWIEMRMGITYFHQQEFLLAATSFERAAESDPRLGLTAHFNSALAWLNQGNEERFEHEAERVAAAKDADLHAQLRLEEGLFQARHSDERAAATLRKYLTDFPHHPRAGEARLALSELEFASGNIDDARHYLVTAEKSVPAPDTPVSSDRADYLEIFLADGAQPRDDAKVIALADQFLERHPKSPLAPEVRMKLGQIYLRQPDYPKAEDQFKALAKEAPESRYAETALFLAGESAMKLIGEAAIGRALDYFDTLAKRDGALKWYARQQQAIIQSVRGREAEAVALYDLILAAQPPSDPELRLSAAIGKGDNLLALGRSDPAKTEDALKVFQNVAQTEGIPSNWRNQALYKKARVLEQLNRTNEAITAYWEVLDANARAADREYFWYYKAGFDAARIFEQRGAWREAIGIYEKMILLDGPRTEEARARTKAIRLEHHIW